MKKQMILAAMLTAISGASFAQNTFELTYTGDVVHTGCVVDPASAAITLNLPDKNIPELVNSTARVFTPFTVQLSNCAAGQLVHGVLDTTNPLSANGGKVQTLGSAEDVAIMLYYRNASNARTSVYFKNSYVLAQNKLATAANVSVPFEMIASYWTDVAKIKSGTATADLTLTLSY